ncbi:unnamed protein product [Rotaria socialis]|uniref:Uncharacterized protein n=1 Tax=Rotaria socialis TaxID=392032 RepID=A0A820Z352_9BILA|nr:unnamed protein product [Rotaria socialis]CAF4551635.1 unnamed protein product [Rotaria socialis]
MSDIIKSDIEKIERALNIRVDDVEIEAVLNAAFPQPIPKIFTGNDIKNEDLDETVNCYDLVKDLNTIYPHIDQSSLLAFTKALNLSYQRNLFQLSKYFQSAEVSYKSNQSVNEIIPTKIFHINNDYISNHLATNNESIQNIRRMMQREEKARLSSNEIVKKLIENIAKNIRLNKQNQLIEKIETLERSTADQSIRNKKIELIKKQLDDLRDLSNKELIDEENIDSFIDWTNICQILMNNQYTEKSCKNAWQQICLPLIHSNASWSSEEDQLLESLVQNYGSFAQQWNIIASHFPQRSSYTCASRYMFLENSRLSKMKFSKDQIQDVKEIIEKNRDNNYISLNKVAYQMGFSLSTIRREWRNIDPNVKRGVWKLEEDQNLLRSVLKQSNRTKINWNLVSIDVIGRSQTKCYRRFIHLTKNNLKKDFQPEEDQLLIQQHQIKNGRWSEIQLLFPGRSSYSLQNRWKKLNEYKKINELFYSQQLNMQLFLLKQYPAKKETVNNINNNKYDSPNIELSYNQLKFLTSNDLFKQFCNEVDLNNLINKIGIRSFINKLSTFNNIQQIKDLFIFQ